MLEENAYVIVSREKNFMLGFTVRRLRSQAVKELENISGERWKELKKRFMTVKCKIIVET